MQVNLDIINYFTSICLFKCGKRGKEGKICRKLNIFRTKRAFSMNVKTFFIVLKGYQLVNKELAGTSLKFLLNIVIFENIRKISEIFYSKNG